MNLNKQLLELLLSQDEEDCRLGFEICRRKGIKATTLNKLDNLVLNDDKYGYKEYVFSDVISDYLKLDDVKKPNKYGIELEYVKWREEDDTK